MQMKRTVRGSNGNRISASGAVILFVALALSQNVAANETNPTECEQDGQLHLKGFSVLCYGAGGEISDGPPSECTAEPGRPCYVRCTAEWSTSGAVTVFAQKTGGSGEVVATAQGYCIEGNDRVSATDTSADGVATSNSKWTTHAGSIYCSVYTKDGATGSGRCVQRSNEPPSYCTAEAGSTCYVRCTVGDRSYGTVMVYADKTGGTGSIGYIKTEAIGSCIEGNRVSTQDHHANGWATSNYASTWSVGTIECKVISMYGALGQGSCDV